MIDVSAKEVTHRIAKARSIISLQPDTLRKIQAHQIPKGDVLEVSRIAAISAAKNTSSILPLCHNLPTDGLSVEFLTRENPPAIEIQVTAKATAKTGVEMEAMTAASVAALTIYDMCKSIDRGMSVEKVELLYKTGGKSGTWQRS